MQRVFLFPINPLLGMQIFGLHVYAQKEREIGPDSLRLLRHCRFMARRSRRGGDHVRSEKLEGDLWHAAEGR